MSVADALLSDNGRYNNFTQDTILDLTKCIKSASHDIVSQVQSLMDNFDGNRKELLALLHAEQSAVRYLNMFVAHNTIVRFDKIV